MGRILPVISLFLLLCNILPAQTVTGRVIDQLGNGLAGLQLRLYTPQKVYTSNSASDGAFTFDNVTFVENEILPTGYSVSQNYPNPFNPKTRIVFSFPERSSVKVNIYNSIGQCVKSFEERTYSAGVNHMDIELNGLSNGVYIAQIVINNKYLVNKKLMLLYGSQHLITAPKTSEPFIYKQVAETKIDSLVVTGTTVYKTTFTNLGSLQGSTLNLGDILMPHPCPGTPTVTYEGKTYNTVQIGTQCWLKENLDVGEMISGTQDQSNNQKIEKYCYNNLPAYCTTYGGLYQWAEAVQYKNGATDTTYPNPAFTGNVQGICPSGWHIPTKTEFETLLKTANYSQDAFLAKGQLSTATNSSGFSGLLAGSMNPYDGSFHDLGFYSDFWSSAEYYSTHTGYSMHLNYGVSSVYVVYEYKAIGYSIRCLKDN